MNTSLRIVGFAAALVAAFGLALWVGRVAGPDVRDDVAAQDHDMTMDGDVHESPGEHNDGHGDHAAYSLELDRARVARNAREVTFTVRDADGQAVTDFDVVHEKRLHLIVVGTPALADFHHLHPTMDADGRWTARLALQPGRYQVYADATTGGENFVAQQQLLVSGQHPAPDELPEPSVLEHTGAYDVAMTRVDDTVTFTVSRNGRPVTDLEPYLGANGHLVVIETERFDYLHAHPLDGPAGPQIAFEVADEDASAHRMFLEVKHHGKVRRVAFTTAASGSAASDSHEEGGTHEH